MREIKFDLLIFQLVMQSLFSKQTDNTQMNTEKNVKFDLLFFIGKAGIFISIFLISPKTKMTCTDYTLDAGLSLT